LDVDDARVGDGDFEDVGGQVFEGSIAGGHRLGVDVPVDVPDIGRDCRTDRLVSSDRGTWP
jgi:hypothetical protein